MLVACRQQQQQPVRVDPESVASRSRATLPLLHNTQYTMHSVQYTVHNVQCTMHYALSREQGHPSLDPQYTEHCTLHITHYTVHSAQCTLATLPCATVHCSTLQYTGHQVQNFKLRSFNFYWKLHHTESTVYHSLRKFYRTLETAAQAGAGWYKVQAAERGRESGSWELGAAAGCCSLLPFLLLLLLQHAPTTTRPLLQALAPTQPNNPMLPSTIQTIRLYLQGVP